MFSKSISMKFLGIVAAVCIVGILGSSISITMKTKDVLHQSLVSKGQGFAASLAGMAKEALLANDTARLDALVSEIRNDPEVVFCAVQDAGGRIVTSAQGNPEAAKVKNPVAATPESFAAGKAVYTKCAPCHGVNGEGGPGNDLIPAAPSLVDDMWDHGSTDGEIFDSIKNGVAPDFNMVPWKDQLKDQDIWNVVNYVRSIAKKK